jgi:hypothetical protein
MLTGPTLLAEIERFLASGFCSATTFGLLVVGDGKLVTRLRAGKTVRLTTAERIISFINKAEADKWPPRAQGRPTIRQPMAVKNYET